MSGLFQLPTGFTNYAIGLDRLFADLELIEDRLVKQNVANHYPPHNLVKLDDTHYDLELAVAGFLPDELEVEVEKSSLTIRGSKKDELVTGKFIHRGIGRRDFVKTFVLGENITLEDASLENGLLRIHLTEIVPEKDRKRLIPVTTPKALLG